MESGPQLPGRPGAWASRNQVPVDAYISELVVARLARPDVADRSKGAQWVAEQCTAMAERVWAVVAVFKGRS
jgi:hypothetical protein